MKSQLVFLVGCPRSGTTLLQSLLASHPDVFSVKETKVFEYVVPLYEKKRYQFGIASRQAKGKLGKFFDEIDQPEYKDKLPIIPATVGQYTRLFFKIMAEITQKSGKSIFLEKTPGHLDHLDRIERHLPEAKVIHIIRDGRDVVASLYELVKKYPETWGYWGTDIEYCVQQWVKAVKLSAAYKDNANHCFISYEKLIVNPEICLRKICDFLGIPFHPSMMSDYKNVSKELIRGRESWKLNTTRAIADTRLKKFKSVFSEKEQDHISKQLNEIDLKQLFGDAFVEQH